MGPWVARTKSIWRRLWMKCDNCGKPGMAWLEYILKVNDTKITLCDTCYDRLNKNNEVIPMAIEPFLPKMFDKMSRFVGRAEDRDESERMTREEAEELADKMIKVLTPYVDFIEICGSYRRGREDPGDLDIVIIIKEGYTLPEIVSDLESSGLYTAVNWLGEKKTQIVVDGVKIDIKVSTTEGLGAALLYFTGPSGYNIGMRRAAKSRGMKLNEYGIWDRDTNTYLGGATEEEIYEIMDKTFKPPEKRAESEDYGVRPAWMSESFESEYEQSIDISMDCPLCNETMEIIGEGGSRSSENLMNFEYYCDCDEKPIVPTSSIFGPNTFDYRTVLEQRNSWAQEAKANPCSKCGMKYDKWKQEYHPITDLPQKNATQYWQMCEICHKGFCGDWGTNMSSIDCQLQDGVCNGCEPFDTYGKYRAESFESHESQEYLVEIRNTRGDVLWRSPCPDYEYLIKEINHMLKTHYYAIDVFTTEHGRKIHMATIKYGKAESGPLAAKLNESLIFRAESFESELDGMELPVCCGMGWELVPYNGDIIITCQGYKQYFGSYSKKHYCGQSKTLKTLKDGVLWEDCGYCGGELWDDEDYTFKTNDGLVCKRCYEEHYKEDEDEDFESESLGMRSLYAEEQNACHRCGKTEKDGKLWWVGSRKGFICGGCSDDGKKYRAESIIEFDAEIMDWTDADLFVDWLKDENIIFHELTNRTHKGPNYGAFRRWESNHGFLRPTKALWEESNFHIFEQTSPEMMHPDSPYPFALKAEEGLQIMAGELSRFLGEELQKAAWGLDVDWDDTTIIVDLSDAVAEDQLIMLFPDDSEIELSLNNPKIEFLYDVIADTAELDWVVGLKITSVDGNYEF
jgi:hypothetical protein